MIDVSSELISIGELARRAGMPVRTIRFYSDSGLLPPVGRSDAGYRLYGPDAPERLALVRTLRALGVDLATVRAVLERRLSVAEVAAAHAAALDAQVRVLRLQAAVLHAAARRGGDSKDLQRMQRLAQLSDAERRRIVSDFLDHAFAGLEMDPDFAGRLRLAVPELPDDATPAQLDAWIELAELVQDEGFRATIRRMSEQHAAARAAGAEQPDARAAAALVAERAGAARSAGVPPGGAEAAAVLDAILPALAAAGEDPRDPAWRARLAERLATFTDARAERYWQLLAIVNGWPPVPATVPAWEWLLEALRAP